MHKYSFVHDLTFDQVSIVNSNSNKIIWKCSFDSYCVLCICLDIRGKWDESVKNSVGRCSVQKSL